MARRQFVNDPQDFVSEALEGLELIHHRTVRFDRAARIIVRAGEQAGPKVGLVSGGGSGHEPLHSGFVGVGMLDAAVPGAIFSSPTAAQVHAATVAADRGQGVLQIIKNYTGDVMNFAIAADLAADDGVEVRSVIVDDDLATDGQEDGPGRRGTAAVVAVEKICGAAAERGVGLEELAALAVRVDSAARTMALALEPLTHPGAERTSFDLPDGDVELGIGIHGERGVARIPFAPARELVRALAEPVVEALGLAPGDRVIAIVNGLGATHPLELAVVHRELTMLLDARGVAVARALVGSYVTALDMGGCSITLVRADDELLNLWDAPVDTPALRW
ncbi:MAG TPA: dihydroxyacetone kinase subunit DhaK [Conexibacter sp.]